MPGTLPRGAPGNSHENYVSAPLELILSGGDGASGSGLSVSNAEQCYVDKERTRAG